MSLSCLLVATDSCSSTAKKISSTFTTNLTENLTTSFVNIAKTSGAYIVGTQTINISDVKLDCAGDVNIGGISQKLVATINFSQITKSVNETTLKNVMEAAVQKAVNSNQVVKTAFMGNSTNTLDQSTTMTNNINKLAANYSYSDFMSDVQSAQTAQSTNFKGISITAKGACRIGDISQDIVVGILAKSMVDRMLNNATVGTSKFDFNLKEISNQSIISNGIGEALGSLFSSIGSIFTQPLMLLMAFIFIIFLGIVGSATYLMFRR